MPPLIRGRKGKPMFKRILVPYDGSENNSRHLLWVEEIAERMKSQIVLARLLEWPLSDPTYSAAAIRPHKEMLEGIIRRLRIKGIAATGIILTGEWVVSFSRLAALARCDLVVLSSRRRSLLSRILGISRLAQLAQDTPCPLWVFGEHARIERPDRFGNLLFLVRDPSSVERGIPLIQRLVRSFRSRIVFFHVAPPGWLEGDSRTALRLLTNRLVLTCDRLNRESIPARFEIGSGSVEDASVQKCEEGFDLTLLPATEEAPSSPFSCDGLRERLIDRLPTPVVVQEACSG